MNDFSGHKRHKVFKPGTRTLIPQLCGYRLATMGLCLGVSSASCVEDWP